jgi:hypothetical protein
MAGGKKRCAVCADIVGLMDYYLFPGVRDMRSILPTSYRTLCTQCQIAATHLSSEGRLPPGKYPTHQGMFTVLKTFVKQRRGLKGNLFHQKEE